MSNKSAFLPIDERTRIATELQALTKLCRDAHGEAMNGRVTTCCHCVCGEGMGGPAGSDACRALQRVRRLLEVVVYTGKPRVQQEVRLEIEDVLQWL